MKKTIAVWLLSWMVFLAFGQGTGFAADLLKETKINAETQRGILARLGEEPVNINHKTVWDTHNIFVLVRKSCGQMQSKDRKTGEIKESYLCLPPGTALDVPRGSTFVKVQDDLKRDEWREVGMLTLPSEGAIVTMCGNGFKPSQSMIGKLDEGRQCPKCEERIVQVPIAPEPVDLCRNMEGFQESIPPGYKLDSSGNCNPDSFTSVVDERQRSFCFRGGWRSALCVGLGLVAVGLAAKALGEGGEEECDTCPGRIPKPAP